MPLPRRPALLAALVLLLVGLCRNCFAGPALNYCVYDPLGAAGDYFAMAKDYQLAALRWGVTLNLKSYNNDAIAAEDFKAGQCDITNMIGLRARLFNTFTGTIDAAGAVEDYAQMRTVIDLISSPKLEKYMVNGQFEMVGLFPMGACYNFVHDRRLNTIASLAGKKIAIMSWDKVAYILVDQFGAIPVASDPTTFGGMFNNGQVDVLIGPILLYKPFELYKGIGDNGGIIRRPVFELTMQLFIRQAKFPPGFGQESRVFVAGQIDRALGIIHNVENGVDPHHWIYQTTAQRDEFLQIMRGARARLAKEGFYDKTMLSILKRVRCKSTQSQVECGDTEE